jgi:hypothetical protein
LTANTIKIYLSAIAFAVAVFFAACKKDDTTCGVQIAVTDSLNNKLNNKWVVFDIPDNTPPSPTGNGLSNVLPIQLNTGTQGFVEAQFDQPAIIQATVYDSADVQFLTPLKKKIVKLEGILCFFELC